MLYSIMIKPTLFSMIPFHRRADSFRAAQPKSDTEDHEVVRPTKSVIAKDRTVSELCIKELKKYTFLSPQLGRIFMEEEIC